MPSARFDTLNLSIVVYLAGIFFVGCHPHTPGTTPEKRDPLIVETQEGQLIGQRDDNGVISFLGVPYAAPPTGEDRWKEPAPPKPHAPLEAKEFKLPCSQIPIPEGSDSFGAGKKIPSSEDCLYLNIWIPPHEEAQTLPVMAWIHGGQYLRGATYQYDGEQLARLGGVIVVTMAYRLGPLGFIAHPALTQESKRHTSGNQALFDHLQALTWLHQNIKAFGGDPNKVTLFGESAGSASTCALMASPLAKGLFQRAILESGSCVGAPPIALREAFGRRLAEALGCKNDDLTKELSCMRSKTDDEVMTAIPLAKVLNDDGEGVGYQFNLDGVLLPEAPREAVSKGNILKMPVILGTTDNEMGRYIGNITTAAQYKETLEKDWEGDAKELLERYPVASDEEASTQMATLYSDWAMTCPVRRDARGFAHAGLSAYLYRFRRSPGIMGPKAGAFHGAELVYLFPSVFKKMGLTYTEDDKKLAQLLIGYWSRFAATGDPNGKEAPSWPRYEEASEQNISLDIEIKTEAKLRSTQCDAWDRSRIKTNRQ